MSQLKPLGGFDVLFKGRFETRHGGHTWTLDVDFLDFGEKLRLYRDGVAVEEKKSPAKFPVGPGATIEASMGVFGMRQVELLADGETTQLSPVDGTLEAWRLGLERDRPRLSRAIGGLSWVVLVVAAVTGLIELVELTGVDLPVTLPKTLATLIGVAALFAAVERALRFKSNRWLD